MPMKKIFMLLLAVIILTACNKEIAPVDKEAQDIDKAIALISANKPLKDTLARYKQKFGVDFILCYSITTAKHRSLSFQVMQSKTEKTGPMKIGNGLYKIRNIQGIDIMFCSSDRDPEKEYNVAIDPKTQELIEKGYITVKGPNSTLCTPSIDFVSCTNDESNFVILSPDFLWKEEVKARSKDVPYIIEDYYPKCN